jgi:RimJ/RimL family protein N-acetyltransferase
MYEYEVPLAGGDTADRSPPSSMIRVETYSPGEVDTLSDDIDFSRPMEPLNGEWVVVASVDGTPIGRTLVSDEPSPYIEPLERSVPVDGAYVRRVFVKPDHRGAGIASNLLREALVVARGELDCGTATALIAADNEPSQRLFEGRGFTQVQAHDYLRAVRFSIYRTRK